MIARPHNLLWLGISVIAFCDFSTASAQSHLNQYKLSRNAIRCVIENKQTLEALPQSTLILDLSSCPPRSLDVASLVNAQDSLLPNSSIEIESGPDSLLIVPKSKLSCFVARLEGVGASSDPALVDFSTCVP